MPTYQYACTHCGHRFDQVQSFSDPSLTDCPVCAGKLRKVYGSIGVVFKGSGFYRTDSRNGGPSAASGAGEKSDAASAPSSDAGKVASKNSGKAAAKSSESGASSSSSTNGATAAKATATAKSGS